MHPAASQSVGCRGKLLPSWERGGKDALRRGYSHTFSAPSNRLTGSDGAAVTCEMISGVGHFPVSENYGKFRPVSVRALNNIEVRHNNHTVLNI